MKIIPILFFLLFVCNMAFAHGVKGEYFFTKKALVIVAMYDDGEPMAYSKVQIKKIDDDHPYQIGFTDYKGRFSFLPNSGGEWIATVKDGMGHMLRLKINLHENLNPKDINNKQAVKSGPRFTKLQGISLGLLSIFLVFGLLFWILSFKNRIS